MQGDWKRNKHASNHTPPGSSWESSGTTPQTPVALLQTIFLHPRTPRGFKAPALCITSLAVRLWIHLVIMANLAMQQTSPRLAFLPYLLYPRKSPCFRHLIGPKSPCPVAPLPEAAETSPLRGPSLGLCGPKLLMHRALHTAAIAARMVRRDPTNPGHSEAPKHGTSFWVEQTAVKT